MPSVESKLRDLLNWRRWCSTTCLWALVLSAHGTPLWFNARRKSSARCGIDGAPRDALPLKRSSSPCPRSSGANANCFCRRMRRGAACAQRAGPRPACGHPAPAPAAAPVRPPVLCSLITAAARRSRPAAVPGALSLLSRLTFREREVALRIRDGLTTEESPASCAAAGDDQDAARGNFPQARRRQSLARDAMLNR